MHLSRKHAAAVATLLSMLLVAAGCHTFLRDSCSTPRPFRNFECASPATAEERDAARLLSAEVQVAVNSYVVKRYWYDPVLGPSESWRRVPDPAASNIAPIVAVRGAGRYLLLHVRNVGAIDGDWFLVYSKARKCVVGEFAWHVQG